MTRSTCETHGDQTAAAQRLSRDGRAAVALTQQDVSGAVRRDQVSVFEIAALVATAVSAASRIPQLRRVIVHGDGRGVSLASATLGIGTELAWVGYIADAGLWSAMAESVLMVVANAVLTIALVRWGAVAPRAMIAGAVWLGLLGAVAATNGFATLALVLAVAYAVQLAPAIWTVWRTPMPTGVSSATWVMLAVEGFLWGAYALHHGDPALACFAAISVLAAAATLARTTAMSPGSVAGCRPA